MAWGDTRDPWSTRSMRDDDQRKTPDDLPEQVLALMQLLYAELREERRQRNERAELRDARRRDDERAEHDDIELAS